MKFQARVHLMGGGKVHCVILYFIHILSLVPRRTVNDSGNGSLGFEISTSDSGLCYIRMGVRVSKKISIRV